MTPSCRRGVTAISEMALTCGFTPGVWVTTQRRHHPCMSPRSYLSEELVRGDRLGTWVLPLTEDECSGAGRLFGGTGLGAAVRALELDAGRPLVWATGQFISHALPGELLTFEVEMLAEGRATTQARARGHVDGREVIAVVATLGRREVERSGVWVVPPDAPPPMDCPAFPSRSATRSVSANLERRLVRGRTEANEPAMDDGQVAMWVRVPDHLVVDPAFLAVLGDYVPWGGRDAVGGGLGGGQSLDNTLRVVDPVDTDWILVDVRISSLVHGYAHGTVHLWSEDGHLLATASQTCQFRNPRSSREKS